MAEDPPLDFFDLSWLAVKGGEPEAIAGVLELSSPVAATWTQGIHGVAGDFWDFKENLDCHNSRVFVAPLVDGWRLVVGGWFGGMGDKDSRAIAECCRRLSERYGAAHAFTTQGRMELYAWTLALSGELQRLFVFDNGPIVDEGTPPEIELQLKQAELANGDGDLWPSEDAVMGIARAFSIAPADLGPYQQSVGQGLMHDCLGENARDARAPPVQLPGQGDKLRVKPMLDGAGSRRASATPAGSWTIFRARSARA